EASQRAALLDQAAMRRLVGLVRVQDLERHVAVELGIVGGVDQTHSADRHTLDDLVPAQASWSGAAEHRLLDPGPRARDRDRIAVGPPIAHLEIDGRPQVDLTRPTGHSASW